MSSYLYLFFQKRLIDCNKGICKNDTCICNNGYINYRKKTCIYVQKKKSVAFCLSFFLGYLGVDWFYLAAGSGFYVFFGILKFSSVFIMCGR